MVEEWQLGVIQARLNANKSLQERNACGQFATPIKLAKGIMRFLRKYIPPSKELSFLEPSLGIGNFYYAFCETFGTDHLATGIEIDEVYYEEAKKLWQGLPLKLLKGDFLAAKPDSRYSLLVTNPPYTRHHHLDVEYKRELQSKIQKTTGRPISGLAGLHCYFLLSSLDWLEEDGISCWLIPSEFMDVNYGEAVKQFLVSQVELMAIHRYTPDDRRFDDALVTSSVVVFKKRAPRANSAVTITTGSDIERPDSRRELVIGDLEPKEKWSRYFSQVEAKRGKYTIGDFFQVKRGIATGCNEFFLLDETEVVENEIPNHFLVPLISQPRYQKAAQRSELKGGTTRYIFNCSLSADELQSHAPNVMEYIRKGEEQGVSSGYICSHRTPWYDCKIGKPAPILVPYMGRYTSTNNPFLFVNNIGNCYATNAYLLLFPHMQFENALRDNDQRERIVSVLNQLGAEEIISRGRVYGGGLYKLEPKELMSVPADALYDILQEGELVLS